MSSSKLVMQGAAGALGGAYVANGVDLNGSTYLDRSTPLRADGGNFTMSLWFKKDSSSNGGALVHQAMNGQYGAYPAFYLQQNSSEATGFDLNTWSGSILMAKSTDTNSTDDGQWNHWVGSWNGTSAYVYLNGVSQGPSKTSGTIPWTTGRIDTRIGGSSVYSNYNGSMAELFIDDSYIDLSQASNRAKFYDSDNKPVDLGDDGSNVTGSQPLVYLKMDHTAGVSNLGDNLGSAGNFTVYNSGSATDGGEVGAFT